MCCLSAYAHSSSAAAGSSSSDRASDYTSSSPCPSARVAWHGCVILVHLVNTAASAAGQGLGGTGGGSDFGPSLSVRQLARGMEA